MTGSSGPAGLDGAAHNGNAASRLGPLHDLRPGPAAVLTATGICCVVIGGLVAAVTGPLELAHGSWLAAYLVLVGGVAQWAMGQARSRRPDVLQPRRSWAQIGCWNVGNLLVIAATLTGAPWAVDLGSILLVIALVLAWHAARPGTGTSARLATAWASLLVDRAYRMLLLVLAVSVPVGMVLSHSRHS
ncbi:hypothetical protein [Paractinoplanes rishiriensis]|uniref:Uncharacterized protein n=1 Tax=Paractinoplanes rishiriensis TaxID=1050105 RepID=A0A919N2R6_9ACTN|nr:hypothetical protein [Actinoplanes rishiriensis]GIF01528.1 hypothetical protein Ari01nite_89920 [Actinoplanes rishiriensis]